MPKEVAEELARVAVRHGGYAEASVYRLSNGKWYVCAHRRNGETRRWFALADYQAEWWGV